MPGFTWTEDTDSAVRCATCNGSGHLFHDDELEDHELFEKALKTRTCPTCGGAGVIINKDLF
jgi:DnaJ-class molecular chaperone